MGKVFWNKPAIPIPPEAYINRHDGTVFIYVLGENQKRHSICIGRLASEFTMFPNSAFRDKFRNEWVRFYGEEELNPAEMHLGMYALTLGVGVSTGLYPLLQEIYGPTCGNMLIDFCMFSLLNRSSACSGARTFRLGTFSETMRDEILFSRQCPDDSDYARLFQDLTEEQHRKFRVRWQERCKEKGVSRAWLSIARSADGSNKDCAGEGDAGGDSAGACDAACDRYSEYRKTEACESAACEQGSANRHRNGGSVSYVYAVNEGDGRPITYFEYECGADDSDPSGSKAFDSKAFHEITLFLMDAGIEIAGIILDSVFCADEVIKAIRDDGYDYVIMMKSDDFGHQAMVKKHGETITWQPEYAVSDDGVFGISEETQLFKDHPESTGFVNLYFDGDRGSGQSIKLIREIRQEKRRLETELSAGKAVSVSTGLENYIAIAQAGRIDAGDAGEASGGGTGAQHVSLNYQNWKRAMKGTGYFAAVSSRNYGAEECLRIYRMRDCSEAQHAFMESLEDFDEACVYETKGVTESEAERDVNREEYRDAAGEAASRRSKFAVTFFGSIIRTEIALASRKLNLAPDDMIERMSRLRLLQTADSLYSYTRTYGTPELSLLNEFGLTPNHLEIMGSEYNKRINSGIDDEIRKIPEYETAVFERRKRGRIKGSKNKKTLEREAEEARINGYRPKEPPPKKKAGRPKGSKDAVPRTRRTRLEMLAAEQKSQKKRGS